WAWSPRATPGVGFGRWGWGARAGAGGGPAGRQRDRRAEAELGVVAEQRQVAGHLDRRAAGPPACDEVAVTERIAQPGIAGLVGRRHLVEGRRVQVQPRRLELVR